MKIFMSSNHSKLKTSNIYDENTAIDKDSIKAKLDNTKNKLDRINSTNRSAFFIKDMISALKNQNRSTFADADTIAWARMNGLGQEELSGLRSRINTILKKMESNGILSRLTTTPAFARGVEVSGYNIIDENQATQFLQNIEDGNRDMSFDLRKELETLENQYYDIV